MNPDIYYLKPANIDIWYLSYYTCYFYLIDSGSLLFIQHYHQQNPL